MNILQLIPDCEECLLEDVMEWENLDACDTGFGILNDEEICAYVQAEIEPDHDNDEIPASNQCRIAHQKSVEYGEHQINDVSKKLIYVISKILQP